MLFVYATILALIVLLVPDVAYAWGPGMHVEVAMKALANLSWAVPVIAGLAERFPDAFLYGASSPDIIVGKKYAGYLHHCHNWRMGWLILNESKTERQRAAAYGYLMHLASDIVAHNYYIPVKIVRSYEARMLSHAYWEMRFDLGVADEAWDRLAQIGELEIEEFDEILERVLRKTLFSFATNKRIFSTILIFHKMRTLRKSLRLYAKQSRFDIHEENRQHYVDLTMEAARDFLAHPDSCACLDVDPAGLGRLAYAQNLRRRMRSMLKSGLMVPKQAETLVGLVREQLALGLYRPEMVLPDVVDVL
jgi:hypothetical protein